MAPPVPVHHRRARGGQPANHILADGLGEDLQQLQDGREDGALRAAARGILKVQVQEPRPLRAQVHQILHERVEKVHRPVREGKERVHAVGNPRGRHVQRERLLPEEEQELGEALRRSRELRQPPHALVAHDGAGERVEKHAPVVPRQLQRRPAAKAARLAEGDRREEARRGRRAVPRAQGDRKVDEPVRRGAAEVDNLGGLGAERLDEVFDPVLVAGGGRVLGADQALLPEERAVRLVL